MASVSRFIWKRIGSTSIVAANRDGAIKAACKLYFAFALETGEKLKLAGLSMGFHTECRHQMNAQFQ